MKGIVKSRVRQDVVQFALPAMVVFAAGLILCARDGYRGLLPVLWRLLRHPSEIPDLSLPQAAGLALLVIGLAIALTGVFTLRRF